MTKEKDLDKLGTVLAMCNDTNKRSLDLLERQQRRQVRMVWTSLAVVVISFLIVGLGMYLTIQGTGNNLAQAIAESTFAAKDCCCTTNRNIDGVKYELSKGIDNNRYELTRNVDALRYDTAQQTCAITTNATANTQKILDKLCQMESNAKDNEIARLRSDLQAAQLTLAQSVQTQNIVNTLKPPPVPAYVVGNPYCNCGNIAGGTTIV